MSSDDVYPAEENAVIKRTL